MLTWTIITVLYAIIAVGLYGIVHFKTQSARRQGRREAFAQVSRSNKRLHRGAHRAYAHVV